MIDKIDDAGVATLNRLLLQPAFRQRLEANCTIAWEELQSSCRGLMIQRAQSYLSKILDLKAARTQEQQERLECWLAENYVVVAFAKFRARCINKPDSPSRKAGVPPDKPIQYLIKILIRTMSKVLAIPHSPALPFELKEPQEHRELGTIMEVFHREQMRRLRECVDKLPPKFKQAIRQSYFSDAKESQIEFADRMNVHRSTIGRWFDEGMKLLHQCLKSKI